MYSEEELVVIASRAQELIKKHGGLRAAGRYLGVSPTYMSKLRDADGISPTQNVLQRMGLERRTKVVRVGSG